MDPMEWQLPGVTRCVGDNCGSDPKTWPLYYGRHQGEFSRLCSSCVILSYRSLYCCGCFFLLGSATSSHDDDPLVAPHEATVTCLACHEAVAHLSCIDYSTFGVFICPACSAAAAGRPFSYAPSCRSPIDMRGARVLLLATRMALTLLEKEGAHAQAIGEKMVAESAEGRKEAYRALSLALGIDTKAPSKNIHILPKDQGKELQIDMGKLDLNEPQFDIAMLDLNEPAPPPSPVRLELCTEGGMAMASNKPPPPSPARLELCTEGGMAMASNKPPPPPMFKYTFGYGGLRRVPAEPFMPTLISGMQQGVRRESAMASTEPLLPSLANLTIGTDTEGIHRELAITSTEPPLPSMAALTLGMEGVCREFATASKVPPPKPRTLQLFSKDDDEEDK